MITDEMIEAVAKVLAVRVPYSDIYTTLDDFRPMAQAAIEAALEKMWQPIETAPKDGEQFLICLENYEDVRWVDLSEPNTVYSEDMWGDFVWPTHWMPLPHPPENS